MLADGLVRAGHFAPFVAPGAVLGAVLLLATLARGGGRTLAWALAFAGAVYIGGLEAAGRGADGTAPLVAVALLLCGELVRWSVDTRARIRGAELPARRRAAAVVVLALASLAAAAIAVGVSAAPVGHGLAWTVLGAAAAVGAAGAGAWLARRPA